MVGEESQTLLAKGFSSMVIHLNLMWGRLPECGEKEYLDAVHPNYTNTKIVYCKRTVSSRLKQKRSLKKKDGSGDEKEKKKLPVFWENTGSFCNLLGNQSMTRTRMTLARWETSLMTLSSTFSPRSTMV
jgi:hypothetical protein